MINMKNKITVKLIILLHETAENEIKKNGLALNAPAKLLNNKFLFS